MALTNDVGHSYLWVDALCIEQDDDPQQKQQQLRIMDKIYQGAYDILVAWTATSCTSPLPGVGNTIYGPRASFAWSTCDRQGNMGR
ncbi:uncharacterized protein G6M90_00g080150 [Metarhizium brunneum]|uniref:Heterokaryon incompatibility domain-containing protein n=1 Tax=Metarhizium brunneum TaxID=500148 RepID=A0A7D5YSQ0_9HYPO|nr:hypothetical protein G6M90_00g080150 [Metarhizium brunneum]